MNFNEGHAPRTAVHQEPAVARLLPCRVSPPFGREPAVRRTSAEPGQNFLRPVVSRVFIVPMSGLDFHTMLQPSRREWCRRRAGAGAGLALLGCALVWLVTCQTGPNAEPLPPYTGGVDPKIEKLMMSNAAIIARADRVAAFIVDSAEGSGTNRANIEGFAILEQGPLLSAAQVARVHQILFDPKSYNFTNAKRCPFLPRLGLVFYAGDRRAHVIACFSCNEWSIGAGDTGKIEDFDPVRAQMIALARELFPRDAVFATLEAGR